MDYLKFACPSCGQHIEAPLGLAGERSHCPSCDGPIAIPLDKCVEDTCAALSLAPSCPRLLLSEQSLEDDDEPATLRDSPFIAAGGNHGLVSRTAKDPPVVDVVFAIPSGRVEWQVENVGTIVGLSSDGECIYSYKDSIVWKCHKTGRYEVAIDFQEHWRNASICTDGVVLSPDCKRAVVKLAFDYEDERSYLVDLDGGSLICTCDAEFPAFWMDGTKLLGIADRRLTVFDIPDEMFTATPKRGTGRLKWRRIRDQGLRSTWRRSCPFWRILDVVGSPDGRHVLTATVQGGGLMPEVRLWDTQEESNCIQLPMESTFYVGWVGFLAGGRIAAAFGDPTYPRLAVGADWWWSQGTWLGPDPDLSRGVVLWDISTGEVCRSVHHLGWGGDPRLARHPIDTSEDGCNVIYNMCGLYHISTHWDDIAPLFIPEVLQASSTPRHQEQMLFAAAEGGDLATVRRLLDQGVNVDAQDEIQMTALCYAVNNGHRDLAHLLIRKGADVDHATPDSVLQWALRRVDRDGKDIVEMLITADADVNHPNDCELTPLIDVISGTTGGDPVPFIELMLEHGADVRYRDTTGFTALHYASGFFDDRGATDATVVELLIAHGADVNAATTQDHPYCAQGTTPLHFAAIRGYADIAAILVTNGANVGAKNAEGKSALDVIDEGGLLGIGDLGVPDEAHSKVLPLLRASQTAS
jgi:ankyrin repeat protein